MSSALKLNSDNSNENPSRATETDATYTILLNQLKAATEGYEYHKKRKNSLKKRIEELMQPSTKANTIRISKEVVNDIMTRLKQFEKEKRFLSPDVNLQGLAKEFQTNYNYLSRIINHIKGKNFSTYINDLRVSYIYTELKTNSLYKMYTVKAIGYEIGFRSTECFSKAFHKKYHMYPSHYLKQL
ncbi:MAG: helix-turn-helix domain-containing protein [Bacteroidetes bacterium]|nr:helix-turn-helix domain-containing protein [Bacteroidota bacterium]